MENERQTKQTESFLGRRFACLPLARESEQGGVLLFRAQGNTMKTKTTDTWMRDEYGWDDRAIEYAHTLQAERIEGAELFHLVESRGDVEAMEEGVI